MDNKDTPQDGQQESGLFPVEKTPEVEERLKAWGVDLSPTLEELEAQKKEEEELKKKEETEKAEAESKRLAKEQAAAEAKKTEEEAKGKETNEEIEITDEQAKQIIVEGKKDNELPWVLEGRQPTEQEVLDYVAGKVDEKRKLEEEAKAHAEAEEQEKIAEGKKKSEEAWVSKWKNDIEFLEKEEKIPTVEKKDDQNDPGLKMRKLIYDAAVSHNELDLRVAYLVYVKPNLGKQPAGADAPVIHPNANDIESKNSDSNPDYYYDDIHGKDTSDLSWLEK